MALIIDPTGHSGTWAGTDENDQLIYIGSNGWEYEFVDGKGGFDSFVISGKYDPSAIKKNSLGFYTYNERVTLLNVEKIVFTDADVALDSYTPKSLIIDPTGHSGTWAGTDENDQLIYIGSNGWEYEFVDGKGGFDSFVISGKYDPSAIKKNSLGFYTYNERVTLLNVEKIVFTDADVLLSSANNAPTGTLNITGTSRVGSTITIDTSSIKDADNFTGYTPTYNYSFEVSNDDGVTWTKLTSTDATDNNSNYTLTTAEVGKQVRGVVSYLDGYGTNEVVNSAMSDIVDLLHTPSIVYGDSLLLPLDGTTFQQIYDNARRLGGFIARNVPINSILPPELIGEFTNKIDVPDGLGDGTIRIEGTVGVSGEHLSVGPNGTVAVLTNIYSNNTDPIHMKESTVLLTLLDRQGARYFSKQIFHYINELYPHLSSADLTSRHIFSSGEYFIISGLLNVPGNLRKFVAIKISESGDLVREFGVNGVSIIEFPDEYPHFLIQDAVQSELNDGQVVFSFAAYGDRYNQNIREEFLAIIQLNSDGSVRDQFGDGGFKILTSDNTYHNSDLDLYDGNGIVFAGGLYQGGVYRGDRFVFDANSGNSIQSASLERPSIPTDLGEWYDILIDETGTFATGRTAVGSPYKTVVSFIDPKSLKQIDQYFANDASWDLGVNIENTDDEGFYVLSWGSNSSFVRKILPINNELGKSSIMLDTGFGKIDSIAQIPFIRRGDSAYVIVQGPTWEEAEANAVKIGGHLVTINDAAENEWLHSNYKINLTLAPQGAWTSYWAGLTDKNSEGSWKWVDGSLTNFTNWATGEPNGSTSENYLHLGWSGGTKWNDTSNNHPTSVSRVGIAEIKLAPNNLPTGTPSITGTSKVGSTITIDATTVTDADNFTGYTPTYNYSFEVSSDNGITWTKLTSTDATDNNSTYTLTTAEFGKQVRGVVSYLDGYGTNEAVNSVASVKIEGEFKQPIIRGNSFYTIVDGTSWNLAEANALKIGGHLIAINSADEQSFIESRNIVKDALWIGYSDTANEGVWKWINGDTTSYSNWQSNEPNNLNEEDYGMIYASGKWNDLDELSLSKGIAETPFIRRGDSAYVIVQGPTWEEAEANAVKLGGHLVTINDSEENQFLFKTILAQVPNEFAFIGLTDKNKEGEFLWSSGEVVSFTNWGQGEPSRTGIYGEEDYGHMFPYNNYLLNDPNAPWNDIDNGGAGGKIKLGIAEIKLAPNNTPTGTPTITGTAKVGSTLTIDASAIKDADNFTGYTPTYNYSFEVSSDNGVNWNKLTSIDATDNNSNYTLTIADVGKQIRGVVNYVDGYGTDELLYTFSQLCHSEKNDITIADAQELLRTQGGNISIQEGIASINDNAFNGAPVTSLTLPSTLKTIGYGAFHSTSLKNLVIPEGVTTIGDHAFSNTQIGSILLPSSIQKISQFAFHTSTPIAVAFAEGVTSINDNAFNGAPVTSLTLPSTLKTIGYGAFHSTSLKNLVIPEGVTTIGDHAFSNTQIGSILLPSSIQKISQFAFHTSTPIAVAFAEGVTSINDNAFNGAPVTSLTLPSTLKTIGYGAFHSTSLKNLVIPEGVTTIGDHAFSNTQIGSILLPSSIQKISQFAFHTSTPIAVAFAEGVTSINDNAFNGAPVTSLTLPSTLKTIGYGAFHSTSLKNLVIPEGVTTIGDHAFSNTQIGSILLPSSIQKISQFAFHTSTPIAVAFAEGVTSINDNAFNGAPVTSLTLPSTLKTIGYGAFHSTSLKNLVIPEGVTTIGDHAFSKTQIGSILLPSSIQKISQFAFHTSTPITVAFAEGVTSINDNAFNGASVTSLTLPSTLKTIGYGAFHSTSLKNLVIPEGVTTIGDHAFSKTQIGSILLPSSIQKISQFAFHTSTPIAVAFAEGVTSINDNAFNGAPVTSLTLPSTLKTIGYGAFHSTSLKNLVIPEGVTTIGDHAFSGSKIESITIPKTITFIGENAFTGTRFEFIKSIKDLGPIGKYESNSIPTGTPSITGTLKVGSTITIDATSIKDADNFTGHTPAFNYSFEISSDNGTTWTKLTSSDASDNNSNYTLTTAEVGKQVRGVVSYLDGYGTNEAVNSLASVVLPNNPPTQEVFTNKTQISYTPSKSVTIPLQYKTSAGDSQLSGLTLNVHYNSSILTPTTTNNGVSDQLPVSITTNKIVPDTNNLDNDPLTDKIIQLVWATFDNTFPNKTLPTTLANLTFNTSSATTDPVTGAPLTTTLRYTAFETASGYDFLTNSTILKASTFNLDVDGDGQVKALTDGLMIIRKLLGPAFDGDALTFKAIGSGATRSTEEIHTYIQGAIDSGMLDVDKNTKTTALTDGLMVIRRLLGPAFDGDALTFKALASDSPYFGKTDAPALVSANIDALRSF